VPSLAEVTERLVPTHLLPDSEEGLREERDAVSAKIQETGNEKDPRESVEYTFNLNHKDGNGKVWGGKFVNKILTIHDRQMVGIMRARLTGGAAYESMDPLSAEINLMVAHLTQSLKERPDWAKNLLSLTDYGVLQAIYMEVDSHESRFHGRKSLKEVSETQSD